jgi:nitroreductase
MGVFDIILRRRSLGKMTDERPTREQIERLLEAATHAPNHYKVEPWRFFVLTGNAREELGMIMQESLLARLTDKTSKQAQALLAKERHKPLRAPVLIIVAAKYPQLPNEVEIENIMATAASVENMLLVAEEMGLAAMWRTGEAAFDPQVKRWLGLAQEDHIVAIVYLGYSTTPRLVRTPTPATEKTTWLGWE